MPSSVPDAVDIPRRGGQDRYAEAMARRKAGHAGPSPHLHRAVGAGVAKARPVNMAGIFQRASEREARAKQGQNENQFKMDSGFASRPGMTISFLSR
jgi:hypothetical protein